MRKRKGRQDGVGGVWGPIARNVMAASLAEALRTVRERRTERRFMETGPYHLLYLRASRA